MVSTTSPTASVNELMNKMVGAVLADAKAFGPCLEIFGRLP